MDDEPDSTGATAKRWIERLLLFAVLVLAMALTGTTLWAVLSGRDVYTQGIQTNRQVTEAQSQLNRDAICNIERLLIIRVQQNGGHVAVSQTTDPCGFPVQPRPTITP